MPQDNEDVVGCSYAAALYVRLGVYPRHLAEQLSRLIDQVGAQVVQEAGGLRRIVRLSPSAAQNRASPLGAGPQTLDATEAAGAKQSAQGEEVGVPAALVESCGPALTLLGHAFQLPYVLRS